jgi:disulfide bond formation protein DsbB
MTVFDVRIWLVILAMALLYSCLESPNWRGFAILVSLIMAARGIYILWEVWRLRGKR